MNDKEAMGEERKESWEVMGTGPALDLAVVSRDKNREDRRNNDKSH